MRRFPVWLAALCFGLGAAAASGQSLESVLMPGKVIEGHADLERDCKNCHVRFDKSAQNGLCLDCHKDVSRDVAQHQGYHGRLKEQDCRVCHTDHKGRNVNIAPLDEKKFDHRLTDFPLAGGHVKPAVVCRDCHKAGVKFREAKSDCVACHKKDDKHKGSLGPDCASCHVDRDWKEVRFDHSKTHFPLRGKHRDVECKDCHKDPGFKNTPTQCIACHRKDDTHKTRFGSKCESCHTERDWQQLRFDHDRDTKYPLRGKHRVAKCTSCHTGFLYKEKTPTTCIACHRKDDEHQGRFDEKCESCHLEKDWRAIRFDHDRDTKYPLRGKHARVKCTDCHKGFLYKEKTETRCYACHLKDDKHKGQQGKDCGQCHNERAWTDTLFDHGLTRFPLLGKHVRVKCKECHATPRFKDAGIECVACHKKDDTHKRRLGSRCEDCHNARDWKLWAFDHDRRTHFKLDGGHKGLSCVACHKRPVDGRPSLSSQCASCHDVDDVHDGSFGKQCARCHESSSWKKVHMGGRPLTR
ncbi:MAG TPA: hypothetical protein VGA00_01880 [Acidiferrobacterales bacterium]